VTDDRLGQPSTHFLVVGAALLDRRFWPRMRSEADLRASRKTIYNYISSCWLNVGIAHVLQHFWLF
jgi:hypothetical protein